MALEDYLEPEIAVTAAVTAVVFSPTGRNILRRGAVYGLAGLLVAGDAVSSLARNVGQGVKVAGASVAQATTNTVQQAKATAAPAESSVANTTQNLVQQAKAGIVAAETSITNAAQNLVQQAKAGAASAETTTPKTSTKNTAQKPVVDDQTQTTEGQA